jgi:hypothetical protein
MRNPRPFAGAVAIVSNVRGVKTAVSGGSAVRPITKLSAAAQDFFSVHRARIMINDAPKVARLELQFSGFYVGN